MKAFRIIMRVISLTLLVSTLICGLYLSTQAAADPSSIQFHSAIAGAAILFSAVTIFLPGGKAVRKV